VELADGEGRLVRYRALAAGREERQEEKSGFVVRISRIQ